MAHKRPVERRLSAILAADLAGYSRLMMHNAEDYGCQADRAFSVRPCQNPIPRLQKGLLNDLRRLALVFFALACSILLLIAVAYLVERRCQMELAFQRAYPEALSELIMGSQPVKGWLED
jgi:hypothetical protein